MFKTKTKITSNNADTLDKYPVLMETATTKIRSSFFNRFNLSPVQKIFYHEVETFQKDKHRVCS